MAVVVERVERQHIVIHHRSREVDDRYTQFLKGLCVAIDALLISLTIIYGTYQVAIVELQLGIYKVSLVLLLPHILEADEAQDDSPQAGYENGKELLVI